MLFDLADYLCPVNGMVYQLSSNETCYSHLDPDGWRTFSKNRHAEEFFVNDQFVGRGADTSLISTDGVNPTGTFYVQYTGEYYGCNWARRYMSPGEAFQRHCRIKMFTYDCLEFEDYEEISTLQLLEHYDSIPMPNGLLVHDSLLFTWGGEEGYLYTRGFGLTGWKNLASGQFANYIVAVNVAPPAPAFTHECLPRPAIFDGG